MVLPLENVERHDPLSGGVGAEQPVGLEDEGKPREKASEREQERGSLVDAERHPGAAAEEKDSERDQENRSWNSGRGVGHKSEPEVMIEPSGAEPEIRGERDEGDHANARSITG